MTTPVIDVHAHVGRTVSTGEGQTVAEYVARMRAANIEQAILSPVAGGRQADGVLDTMRENDAIAEGVRAHPLQFPVGLAAVEVRHEERALEELERAFDRLGLRGLAVHAMFSGFVVGVGGVLDPLLELADQREALCLMHALPEAGAFSMESPRAIGALAERFPRVTFIMGHPAITADQRGAAIEAAAGRENVYLDLAFQESSETVEVLVRALGAERVVFGSDAPFRDPGPTIRSVHAARISDDAKERILHRNARDLIERIRRRGSPAERSGR
jgi:predicted TIM-barrel fold metal-dependent hydrolase